MIEILVAVAIIAILLSMGLYAFNRIINTGRLNATKVTLGNLKGMLSELETAQGGKLTAQPAAWLWWSGTSNTIINPPAETPVPPYTPNFWSDPYHIGNQALAPTGAGTFDALGAPGDVSADVQTTQRLGSIAIVNTNLAMSFLAASPANRSRLGAIPQDSVLVPARVSGQVSAPGPDLFLGFGGDPTPNVAYVPGVHVKVNNVRYVASAGFTPVPGNPAVPGAGWADETAAPSGAPLMLDGWGNPIIFVPATGLRVRLLNGESKYDPMNPAQNFIVTSSEGQVQKYDVGMPGSPFVTTPGRPFWASAGPDGDFSKGDDNVYSFEQ